MISKISSLLGIPAHQAVCGYGSCLNKANEAASVITLAFKKFNASEENEIPLYVYCLGRDIEEGRIEITEITIKCYKDRRKAYEALADSRCEPEAVRQLEWEVCVAGPQKEVDTRSGAAQYAVNFPGFQFPEGLNAAHPHHSEIRQGSNPDRWYNLTWAGQITVELSAKLNGVFRGDMTVVLIPSENWEGQAGADIFICDSQGTMQTKRETEIQSMLG